jgi:hypothetical protein
MCLDLSTAVHFGERLGHLAAVGILDAHEQQTFHALTP